MNVKLATQLLSQSTVEMIHYAIADDGIMLSLNNKGMYNHVTDFCERETWFCIKSLLLGHVVVMHIYCVIKGESISPWTMNTDTVECFFGDARQMVGGSTNKLTAAGFNRADKKASKFNAAKFSLVGNNSTGDNIFGRNKRF